MKAIILIVITLNLLLVCDSFLHWKHRVVYYRTTTLNANAAQKGKGTISSIKESLSTTQGTVDKFIAEIKEVSRQDTNTIKSVLGQNRKVLKEIVEVAENTQAYYFRSRRISSFQNALLLINSCSGFNRGSGGYGSNPVGSGGYGSNPIYKHIFFENPFYMDAATQILLVWMQGYVFPVSEFGVEKADTIMAMMTKLTGFPTKIILASNGNHPCYQCVDQDADEDDEDE